LVLSRSTSSTIFFLVVDCAADDDGEDEDGGELEKAEAAELNIFEVCGAPPPFVLSSLPLSLSKGAGRALARLWLSSLLSYFLVSCLLFSYASWSPPGSREC
jgi:hypothetical protein